MIRTVFLNSYFPTRPDPTRENEPRRGKGVTGKALRKNRLLVMIIVSGYVAQAAPTGSIRIQCHLRKRNQERSGANQATN